MVLRRFLPYVFALAFAAGALWLYYELSRADLPPASPMAAVPEDATELWWFRDPYSTRKVVSNQPAYLLLHPAIELLNALPFPAPRDEPWVKDMELVVYRTEASPESAVAVFGLPAGWSRQQQEAWCVNHLNARPLKSGWFELYDETRSLHLRIIDGRAFIAEQAEAIPGQLRQTEKSALENAAQMGANKAVVQVRRGSGGELIPFISGNEQSLFVRDIYLANQHLYGEEIVVLSEALPHLSGLPAGWQRVIPDVVTRFEGIGLESGYELIDLHKSVLQRDGALAAWNGRLAELESAFNTDVESALGAWWNGGLAVFEAYGTSFVLMGVADLGAARRGLSSFGAEFTEPFLGGTLIVWEQTLLIEHLFPEALAKNMRCAWVRGGEVIFGADQAVIMRLASRVSAGQVIDDGHLISRALFRGESFVKYMQQDQAFENAIAGLVLPAYAPDEDRTATHLLFSGVRAEANRLVTRFDLSPAASVSVPASFVWEVPIVGLRPETITAVRNHNNGQHYVVVQDTLDKLHALDARGKSMWVYQADGPLRGEVITVDLLKNNKVQLIFSTDQAIHGVDALGRSIQGFPIRPGQGRTLTSPVLVADYDNNRNYRFIVGASDGSLLNYKSDGKPTAGWNFKRLGSPPLQTAHLRVGNADYVFVSFKDGRVQLLKRNGEVRHKTALRLPPYSAPPIFRVTGSIEGSSVIVSDTSGTVIEASFGNGAPVERSLLREAEAVLLGDLNRNRLQDMIFVNGSVVSAYDAGGKELFRRDFKAPLLTDLRLYQFAQSTRVGVVIPSLGEVHLLEFDGTTADGFPLFAGGPCVIRDFTGDGRLEVVTTDGLGMVVCYRL